MFAAGFLLGLMVGGGLGVIITALCVAARDGEAYDGEER